MQSSPQNSKSSSFENGGGFLTGNERVGSLTEVPGALWVCDSADETVLAWLVRAFRMISKRS